MKTVLLKIRNTIPAYILLLLCIISCGKSEPDTPTPPEPPKPTATAPVMGNIKITTTNGITVESSITSDGGSSITSCGFCWNTLSDPTVANSTKEATLNNNAFSSTISGLLDGTKYYIRGYAKNQVGTSYTTQIEYTTPVKIETLQIPDKNFKQYLVTNFDTDKDGEISVAEANAITKIDVITDNIENVLGMESFSNLIELTISGSLAPVKSTPTALGKLTTLNVSKNTKLEKLNCSNNKLVALDISSNKPLKYLLCNNNPIPTLNVSQNLNLIQLECANCSLSKEFNIVSNTKLEIFNITGNNISTILVWDGFNKSSDPNFKSDNGAIYSINREGQIPDYKDGNNNDYK